MTSVLQPEDDVFKSLSSVELLFIFYAKATPMNEKLKIQFGLKCEPFRQLGEGLILKKVRWNDLLSTSRLYSCRHPLRYTKFNIKKR